MALLIPLVLILVGLGVVYAVLYNSLIHSRQKAQEAWSGIDVQLKRRYDLIPNLVKTVKGYAEHEKGVLEEVTNARAKAIEIPEGKVAQQAGAENFLTSALRSVFAVAENYPDLKANQNFLNLQNQLAETEDQISAARRIYNGNVTVLNTKVQSFPSNIVANAHHFELSEFFELESQEREEAQKTPEVNF